MRSIRSFFTSPLGKLTTLGIIPLLTLWGIRAGLRSWMGDCPLDVGLPWQEMAVPLAFVLFSLLQRLETTAPLELARPSTTRSLTTGFLLLGAVAVYFSRAHFPVRVSLALFCILALLAFLASLLLWWPQLSRLGKACGAPHRRDLLFAAGAIASLFLLPLCSAVGWGLMVHSLMWPVRLLVGLVGISPNFYFVDGVYYLSHRNFSVCIGRPCGGFEGLFLFLYVFCLISLRDARLIRITRYFQIFAGGIVLMWSLNVFRIVAFYGISFHAIKTFGAGRATNLFSELAHSNIGWAIYLVGIVAYALVLEKLHWFGNKPQVAS